MRHSENLKECIEYVNKMNDLARKQNLTPEQVLGLTLGNLVTVSSVIAECLAAIADKLEEG